MNKLTLIALIFLLMGSSLMGQSRLEQLGNRNYDEYSYDRAIKYYEELDNKSTEVKRKLAVSYFKTQDFDQAEWYYTQLVESPEAVVEDYYNFSQVLAMQEKYPESVRWMFKYQENKADIKATQFISDPNYFESMIKEENGYKLKNLDINTADQEFGATFFKEDVVFVSSRVGLQTVVRRWNWNQLGFLDIFQAEQDTTDMELMNPERHHKKFNKKYHEGPASFNLAGDRMVFTRNNYKSRSSKGEVNLEMYESKLIEGVWQKPTPLPFNNREYSVGHGSLSQDGNVIYFISDKPGGYGGTDLYKAERNEAGDWTEPILLGDNINTDGNEMFPYMHPDSILFFSSNGHIGIGGLDIFYVDVRERGLNRVTNMNAPVNSSKDDFAFIINDERTKGYLSSNRKGGRGDDDIYSFTREEPLKFYQLLRGKVIDELGAIVPNTRVVMRNSKGNVVGERIADAKGEYMFEVEEDEAYSLIAEKETYSRGLGKFATDRKNMEFKQNLMVTRVKPEKSVGQVISMDGPVDMTAKAYDYADQRLVYKEINTHSPGLSILSMVRDIRNGEPIPGAEIYLYDKITGEETLMESPETGDNTWILEQGEYANRRFAIKVIKPGYQPMEFDFETPDDAMGQHSFLTKLIPVLQPDQSLDIDLTTLFDIRPIFFDLDKYNIRSDAKIELNKIVELMNAKPKLVIELTSHTDCRASMGYNDRLSNNRALATAKYIRKRIKHPERVTGKGTGEKKLFNDCACEGEVKSDCSEEEHQMNRRTEFTIVKM
jgi:outer membrane protein OmpA-like peptidoglycan-associated protein